ncbi:MAG: biotin--[acetyl-CoA-carboxylase] ligase [Desulfobacterales bacterium]|jgi:BirA family biotin operon repressor/biotin-[acetyl-CoA-carboxylase] ligase|nr:biotin--[acetyl-CoA-carboxylase] ligase [Desulfobacterales bacterium]
MEYKAEDRCHNAIFGLFYSPNNVLTGELKLNGKAELTGFECRKQKAFAPENNMPLSYRQVGSSPDALMLVTAKTCASSMDLAWRLAGENRFPEWASVLVSAQTAGRGQFQRHWHSPPGNVYGSLRVPAMRPVWGNLFSLLLAKSMAEILKGLGLAPAIKWPNDLLVGGKKVGGILIEAKSDIVIAGLGLNLISAPRTSALHSPLAPAAGCLQEFGVTCSPLDLWVPFVRHLRSQVTETLLHGNPEQFVGNLRPHLAYIGERILLDAFGEAERPVIFQGITADGAITVQTTEGERIFRSGSMYPVA